MTNPTARTKVLLTIAIIALTIAFGLTCQALSHPAQAASHSTAEAR
jgi:hypothetical protein